MEVLNRLVTVDACLSSTVARVDNRQMNGEQLLEMVTNAYLRSADFNGFSFSRAAQTLGDLNNLTAVVSGLVESGRLELLFNGTDLNPAVKRFPVAPFSEQVQQLRELGLMAAWAYPAPSHLAITVDAVQYAGRPFTLRMALGEPQLKFQAFDPSILEMYRNDPRFHYECDDTQGSFFLSERHRENMQHSEDSYLETFGFAYDDSGFRAVAAYLRYLGRLSPKHQQIWDLNKVSGTYRLHPDYCAFTEGSWNRNCNVFDAILDELRTINAFSNQMRRPPLFRNEFDERPKDFAFLIRPTTREYRAFALTLDQMLSDNISLDFFQGEVETTEQIARKNGTVAMQQKGTLKMLEEWLRQRFTPKEPELFGTIFTGFRKIRKERQTPAHVVEQEKYDKVYFEMQRDMLSAGYNSLRCLRTAFQQHPGVRPTEVQFLPPDDRQIWMQ